jgi:hypothetical protein
MGARGRRRYSEAEEARIWEAMTDEERAEYSALAFGADIAVANLAAMRAIRNAAMERMEVKW